ncbi:holin [Paenibacillus sp. BIHB 4019]|uniref:Holin n=1 Tax=Paenibacillus sp. BIHB 4019 TaxID=1870819 RepID=A0A1B2DJ71_9BACL|nr:phage holin family protein [Paenibacillus sp. BIHB 4019]ANY67746.1 holin [Paenibacillus sp. BIHB 4019]
MSGQIILNGGAGVAGAFIAFAFGGWTEALTFLLIAMVADIITGISASFKEGRGLNSAIGSVGGAKKGLMLLVIILAHRIDVLLGLDNVAITAATYFYIANELISITENYGRLGLPLPDKFREMIDVLKRKGGVK